MMVFQEEEIITWNLRVKEIDMNIYHLKKF